MKNLNLKMKGLWKKVNNLAKDKTGSSLLMVVLVMSICIIMGTSIMLISFSTFSLSNNNKEHKKATALALSCVDTVKVNIVDILETNATSLLSLSEGAALELEIVGEFDGTVLVTMQVMTWKPNLSPESILITIKATVGDYTESISFTAFSSQNSQNDIINAVGNSMALKGGGSFSIAGKQIVGDVSLHGDYLVAPAFRNLSQTEMEQQGEINGNLYVNGSATLGTDTDAVYISGNVYVNGDLIINSCFIGSTLGTGGNVYVAGNIILNGLTSDVATIRGNVYCGGNFYVQNNEISGYNTYIPSTWSNNPEKVEMNNYSAFNPTYGKYIDNEAGADAALTALILGNNTIYKGLAGNKTITNVVTNSTQSVVTFSDNTTATFTADLVSLFGNIGIDAWSSSAKLYLPSSEAGGDNNYPRQLTSKDGINYYWVKSYWINKGKNFNKMHHVVNAEREEEGYSGNGIPTKVILPYESARLTGNIITADIKNIIPINKKSLTIIGNVFVQGDAVVQTNSTIGSSGKVFEVAGDLTVNSVASYNSTTDGIVNVANGVCTFASTVSVGGSIKNTKAYTEAILPENFYFLRMHCWTSNRWNTESKAAWLKYNSSTMYPGTGASANFSEYDTGDSRFNITVYFNSKAAFGNRQDSIATLFGATISSTGAMYASWENNAAPSQSTPMFSSAALAANSSYASKLDQKNAPTKVADVFKEMGVWGYNVNTTAYKDGLHGKVNETTSSVINKTNDAEGVNFTGVSIVDISFASTLFQANRLYKTITFYGNDSKQYAVPVTEGSDSYSVLHSRVDLVGSAFKDLGSATSSNFIAPSQSGSLLSLNYLFVWACNAYTGETFTKFSDSQNGLPDKYWASSPNKSYNPAGSGSPTGDYISQFYPWAGRSGSLFWGSYEFGDTAWSGYDDRPWIVRNNSDSQTNHYSYLKNFKVPYDTQGRNLADYLNWAGSSGSGLTNDQAMDIIMEWGTYLLRDLWVQEYQAIVIDKTMTYDQAFWLKYVGVQACYNVSNPVIWNYFIMRDIYIDGEETGITSSAESGARFKFGNSTSSNYKESIWIDTTFGNTRLYIRPTGYTYSIRGADGGSEGAYVENAVVIENATFETKTWNFDGGRADHIGYVYIIPNFYKGANANAAIANSISGNRMTGGSNLNNNQLLNEYTNMVMAPKSSATYNGSSYKVYQGKDGSYYTYDTKVEFLQKGYVIKNDRTTKMLFETSKDSDGGLVNNTGSFLFIMSEGPLHIRMGYRQQFAGIMYAPHAYSVWEIRDGSCRGTVNGGSIVTGQVWTNCHNDNQGNTYNLVYNSVATMDPDFKDKLSQGLNVATIENGTNTNVSWTFGSVG